MTISYVKIFKDQREMLDALSDAEVGRLMKAAFKYAFDGIETQLGGNERFVWFAVKSQIDKSIEGYQRICQRNKENISKRYQSLPTVTSGNQSYQEQEQEQEQKNINNNIFYKHIKDMFNDTCVSFPKLTVISENRKKTIKARLNKYSLDQMQEMFTKAEASDFLKGANSRDWRATFDWLMKDSNFAKVLDGNYDNKASPPNYPPKAGGKTRLENEHNYDVKMLERALFGDDG